MTASAPPGMIEGTKGQKAGAGMLVVGAVLMLVGVPLPWATARNVTVSGVSTVSWNGVPVDTLQRYAVVVSISAVMFAAAGVLVQTRRAPAWFTGGLEAIGLGGGLFGVLLIPAGTAIALGDATGNLPVQGMQFDVGAYLLCRGLCLDMAGVATASSTRRRVRVPLTVLVQFSARGPRS
jgi:predicted Kef-type K+ transport protein